MDAARALETGQSEGTSAMRAIDDAVVEIYTDGACSGNPGPGGWGVVLQFGPHEKELYGAEAETTNNRMELTAAIRALEALTRPMKVRLHTDSIYVRSGITSWIHGWKRKGWQTAEKKPVKNADLWRQLDTLTDRYDVEWVWVKGHDGDVDNERADTLACRGRDAAKDEARDVRPAG